MAKTYAKCKLCGTMKFLNYAGLCKKCNRKAESSKVIEEYLAKEREMQAAQAEQLKERQKLMDEFASLDKMETRTSDQEKRLQQLREQLGIKEEKKLEVEEGAEPKEGEEAEGEEKKEDQDKGDQEKPKE